MLLPQGWRLRLGRSLRLQGCLWYLKRWTPMHISPASLACCPPPFFHTHHILGKTSCLFCPLRQWLLSAGDDGWCPLLMDAPAGAVLEGQGGEDGTRRAGCRQHGHTGSRRPSGISLFPKKKGKGRGQVPRSAVSRHSCPGSRCHTLAGAQGAGDACVPHDGDTILGLHKAGRHAAAFSAPDFYHLEEGGWPGWLCNYTLQIHVPSQGSSRPDPRTRTFFIHVAFSPL